MVYKMPYLCDCMEQIFAVPLQCQKTKGHQT